MMLKLTKVLYDPESVPSDARCFWVNTAFIMGVERDEVTVSARSVAGRETQTVTKLCAKLTMNGAYFAWCLESPEEIIRLSKESC